MTGELFADERGVRNVLGYVLTFSIIVVSVGVVSTAGYQQLTEFRETEQLGNAERGLELVADNFDDLQQGRASARSGDLDLAGGDLTVVEGPEMRVSVTGSATDYEETLSVGGLRYRYRGTTVSYENGALFRTSPRNDTGILSRPTLVCSDDRALVSVVSLRANDTEHVGGGTAQVVGEVTTRTVRFPRNRAGEGSVGDVDAATVTVSSPRADGWAQYFRDAGDWASTGTDAQYRCSGLSEVYVRQTNVTVDLRAN